MLHVFNNPVRVYDLGEGFTMLVGGDTAGRLAEVGFIVSDDGVTVIVHAMRPPAKKYR